MEHAKLNGLVGVRFEKHLTNLACWLEIENLVTGGPFSAVTLEGVSGYPETRQGGARLLG